jgi:hypothetical protein
MSNVIKITFFAFISCQVIGASGFGFVDTVFAAEPAPLSVKSGGAWQKPALLSKAVNSGNRPFIRWPAAAINDKGDGIAVWVQPDSDLWPRVLKSEYRDGKWLAPGFLSLATGDANNPKVTMAANGDVVVVWNQMDVKAKRHVFMAERRNGTWKLPQSDSDRISVGEKYAWEHDVAMNDKGEAVIVWSQESESGVHAIYKSEYRNGAWKHPQDINDYISPKGGDALQPKVAINNNGAVLIAWDQSDSNEKSQIYISELRDNKWSHPADVNDHINPKSSGSRGGAYRPLVGMDEAGNAAVSWQQTHSSKQGIYLSEYRQGKWHHPKSLDTIITPPEVKSPSIHDLQMGGNGNVIILWNSFKKRRDSLYKSELRLGKWHHPSEDDPFIASTADWEFKILGKSAVSASGRAIIGWLQRGGNRGSEAYFAEYENGNWHFPGQLLNDENMQATGLAVAVSSKGNSVVSWSQTDGKNEGIYGKVFRVKK